MNSSYPYLAIVMASVNGTHITIQLDTKCSFENNNKISNSRMKISYSSDSINLKQLNDKRTSYSLEVVLKQSKNLNSSPSKVNSMECTVNIIFLNHTEFHNYQIKKLNISTLSHKDNYFNISTFNGSKIINSEIDYIVIENEHKYPIEVLYTFRYYPVVPRRSMIFHEFNFVDELIFDLPKKIRFLFGSDWKCHWFVCSGHSGSVLVLYS